MAPNEIINTDQCKAAITEAVEGAKKMISIDKMKESLIKLRRDFELNDLRLLAECVYTAKFLTEGQAKRLVDAVCESVEKEQAKTLRYDPLLTDRVKTDNHSLILKIAAVGEAMCRELDGQRHLPEKISFHYLKPVINEQTQQVELSKGDRLVVSPYRLMINSGKYYLLAFDDESRQMRTYRVDRMDSIERTGHAREGEEIFRKIDLEKYASRVFSTGGDCTEPVKLQFPDRLLEAAIERFGTSGASYVKADDAHFTVTTAIGIDDRFFGWLTGCGEDVTIIEPASVVTAFTDYLDNIRKMY